jgi:transcriptional regulator with XRE-family HTH domain
MDADDPGFDLKALGERVRAERQRLGLSAEALSKRAGISRSMLSAVEAAEKAPTVLVLHKIATGLNTSMTRLLGEERSERVILLPREEQIVVRDPSGWVRRNLAPALPGIEFEFMRTTIPPGVEAGTFPAHAPGALEYVAVERGELLLTIGREEHWLEQGDSIFYIADCEHAFANPGDEECVYYLALEAGIRGAHD